MDRRGVALVVERDPDMRDTLACWLADEWEVAMARNCAHALNDYTPVDVLVVSGDAESDVSAVLRQFVDRGYTGPAVVLTARECDPTVADITTTTLCKPVRQRALRDAVDEATRTGARPAGE